MRLSRCTLWASTTSPQSLSMTDTSVPLNVGRRSGMSVGSVLLTQKPDTIRFVDNVPDLRLCEEHSDEAISPLLQQLFHFIEEFRFVFELAVNGSKTYIGDLIQLAKLFHDDLADLLGSHLTP